jgi:hypothetical protein
MAQTSLPMVEDMIHHLPIILWSQKGAMGWTEAMGGPACSVWSTSQEHDLYKSSNWYPHEPGVFLHWVDHLW